MVEMKTGLFSTEGGTLGIGSKESSQRRREEYECQGDANDEAT